MFSNATSLVGRHLLNRRSFLRDAGTGLGGIALTALLAEKGLLRADGSKTPIRPDIRPETPLAARPSHYPPKAKRVLLIFCSGAVSHVDTLDYKPELVEARRPPDARHRQARHLPGRERQPRPTVVAVQAARAERQDGLGPVSEPRRTGRRDVLHPLDDGPQQHARTGREPDEHRLHARRLSQHRRLGQLRPGQRLPRFAGFRRHSRSPRRAAGRSQQLGQRLPAGRVPGCRLQRRQADPQSRSTPRGRRRHRVRDARLPADAQRQTPGETSRRH